MSGIFGVTSNNSHSQMLTYYALYALQHRGEYVCGIATNTSGYIDYKKGYGLASSVIEEETLKILRGKVSLGHVSNSQVDIEKNEIDPKVIGYEDGTIAVNFDGHLLNYDRLKKITLDHGCEVENDTHTEIVANLIAINYNGDIEEAIVKTIKMLEGAFAILIMEKNKIYAIRDRYGIKPLVYGKNDYASMFSSETCAFDALSAEYVRDLEPGEMIVAEGDKIESKQILDKKCNKSCIFEVIYTSRPDSIINGMSVYKMRRNSGRKLAKTCPEGIDVVIAAPDSGTVASIGFAEGSKVAYGIGIIKNRYIGRTFIEKTEKTRVDKVRIKLNVLKEIIDGKNVLVVDDSIVRGTTMMRTVKMLKDAGAKSVHVRVASPMVFYNCKIGVNKSVTGKMLAMDHSLEEIRQAIGADSLEYITYRDMVEAFGGEGHYCTGCINNVYPENLEELNGDRL